VAMRPACVATQPELSKAHAVLNGGKADAAARVLREATARSPANGILWRELGMTLIAAGQDRDAIDALRRASQLITPDVDLWCAIAVSAHRIDRHAESIGCWQKALTIQPDFFLQRPHFRVLWRESRRAVSTLDMIVDGLAASADPIAFDILLNAISSHDDVALSLDILSEVAEPSVPVRVATEVLHLANGEESAPTTLNALVSHQSDQIRERIWARIGEWFTRRPEFTTGRAVFDLLASTSNVEAARAFYRAAHVNSDVCVAALSCIAGSTLEAVRRVNAAA